MLEECFTELTKNKMFLPKQHGADFLSYFSEQDKTSIRF